MNISELLMDGSMEDVNTVGEFLEKYGKNYHQSIDEDGFKKQLDYLEKTLMNSQP